jgi:elongator complex protein 1
VSEPIDGLEGALSWRPSGNLIAGVRRSSDKAEVVFFERNGLRHGQFDLRLSNIELEELRASPKLKWNSDSNVLSVAFPDKVQLWTMSNYHYYLKQELAFTEPASHMVQCAWHPERPLALAISTPGKPSPLTIQLSD